MKKIKWLAAMPLAMVLAFSPAPGGDSYKVYLGGKLLTEQFVHFQKSIPTLAISPSAKESVSVQFSHCGVQGKARSISIRTESGKIFKEWRFGDSDRMEFSPGELAKFGTTVSLYYASKEIPDGKLLAKLDMSGGTSSRK